MVKSKSPFFTESPSWNETLVNSPPTWAFTVMVEYASTFPMTSTLMGTSRWDTIATTTGTGPPSPPRPRPPPAAFTSDLLQPARSSSANARAVTASFESILPVFMDCIQGRRKGRVCVTKGYPPDIIIYNYTLTLRGSEIGRLGDLVKRGEQIGDDFLGVESPAASDFVEVAEPLPIRILFG